MRGRIVQAIVQLSHNYTVISPSEMMPAKVTQNKFHFLGTKIARRYKVESPSWCIIYEGDRLFQYFCDDPGIMESSISSLFLVITFTVMVIVARDEYDKNRFFLFENACALMLSPELEAVSFITFLEYASDIFLG